MDIGTTLTKKEVDAAVRSAGLDPYSDEGREARRRNFIPCEGRKGRYTEAHDFDLKIDDSL